MKLHMRVGEMLVAIGALHTLFAFARHADPLGSIAGDVFWNSVSTSARGHAVWFLLAGPLFMLLGWVVRSAERRGVPAGGGFGGALLAITLVSLVLMPVSGFWLLLPPAFLALRSGEMPAPSQS